MMGTLEVALSLLLAAIAMYGLGLPLAWLLPAPAEAAWVYRISVGPLYAMVVTSLAAWVLGLLGVPLHPVMIGLLLVVCWAAAWWRARDEWRRELRGHILAPALMVATAGFTWLFSLVGYGLYLPNRDFKIHAYIVAQVAWTRSSDPSLVLRHSPNAVPNPEGLYPLGLHSLLGWILPTSDWQSVGITAASAVLATSISMPLALVTLARMWSPPSVELWVIAGASAVFILGLTEDFRIGSVVLLVGASLFPAALAALWLWLRSPTLGSFGALGLSGAGLFVLHISEAVGLALVAVACLPLLPKWRTWPKLRWQFWLAAVATLLIVGLVAQGRIRGLLAMPGTLPRWDAQPNTEDLGTAFFVSLLQQPSGDMVVALLWLSLGIMGFWIARSRKASPVPLIAFSVPVILGTVAGARLAPSWLNMITAPWYGTAARIGLMAAAPLILAASLSISIIAERFRARGVAWAGWLVVVSTVGLLAVQVVPVRRADLAATLAGAGDTQDVARHLSKRLREGESVLNFEGDGTANLFAFSRVPVLVGINKDPGLSGELAGGVSLSESLLRLDDPLVAQQLKELGVAYLAFGTTSRYWRSEPGYAWQQVLAQPEVELEMVGTDMVVLRYEAGSS